MKKAVISVLTCTAVFALVACGKTAAAGNSSDSTASTVSTTTVTTSTQMEDVQKPTRVNQESQLSAGSPKYTPIDHSRFYEVTTSRTHHSETNHHH